MQSKVILLTAIVLVAVGAVVAYIFIATAEVKVLIKDDPPWFFPAVLEIKPETTVTWKLEGAAIHPVMTVEEPEGVGEINSGHFTKTWSYTFTKPGVYVYICPIHPYMKGVIGVGTEVPEDKIPAWVKQWPPQQESPPLSIPEEAGKGEIWVGAQFHKPLGKEKPGTIIIINAETWEIEDVLDDSRLNNPHNIWEVDGKIIAANWFARFISVFDKGTRVLEKHVLIGESPAHVHAHSKDKIYVTIQGDDGLAVLDENFAVTDRIRAPKGPHGHWMSADGTLMALASTERGKITVWNTSTDKIIFEEFIDGEATHSLPLMAGITPDGKYAFAATSGTGNFYVFDIANKSLIKSFSIGSVPIQTVPSPDGRYVFVPLTGDGAVSVISVEGWEVAKKIENVGYGAHGVYFGEKKDGGLYAYVSNKFTTWVTVIDVETLEIAGYVQLPEGAWGGQGILVTA